MRAEERANVQQRWWILCGCLAAGALVLCWPTRRVVRERVERVPSVEHGLETSEGAAEHPLATPSPLPGPAAEATAGSRREPLEPEPAAPATPTGADESWARLSVHVVAKETGAPLANVRVMVLAQGRASAWTHVAGTSGTLTTSPMTEAEGRVEFELPPGLPLRLQARSSGDPTPRAHLEIEALATCETRTVSLELPTELDVLYFGKVLAADDRRPIAGASVQAVHTTTTWSSTGGETWRSASSELLAEQLTGPDGIFELRMPSWIPLDIHVRAEGFAYVLLEPGTGHGTPDTARIVLLARAATLHARLLDAGGGPVPDVDVWLSIEAHHLGLADHGGVYFTSADELSWGARTDSSGECEIGHIPPGVPIMVELLRGGLSLRRDLPELSLSPGERREVEWRLGSGCLVAGLALDAGGKPVPELAIWLQRADYRLPRFFQEHEDERVAVETRTDAHGRFELDDVSPGTWWIGPAAGQASKEPDLEAVASLAELLEIPAGLARHELVLRVHRGLTIRGTVLDPQGAPASDQFVWASGEAASHGVDCTSAEDGTFVLGPLVPGRFTLQVSSFDQTYAEPVEASAGDEGVVLRLLPAGTLRGTVRDGATGEVVAATVDYVRVGDEGAGMAECGDGHFRLGGLEPGTYELCARASGMRIGRLGGLVVRSGEETRDLELRLEPGARLRVKFAGSEGHLRYRVLCDGVIVADDGMQAGGTSETVVPGGRIVVESFKRPDVRARQELVLVAGEEREVVLDDPR